MTCFHLSVSCRECFQLNPPWVTSLVKCSPPRSAAHVGLPCSSLCISMAQINLLNPHLPVGYTYVWPRAMWFGLLLLHLGHLTEARGRECLHFRLWFLEWWVKISRETVKSVVSSVDCFHPLPHGHELGSPLLSKMMSAQWSLNLWGSLWWICCLLFKMQCGALKSQSVI